MINRAPFRLNPELMMPRKASAISRSCFIAASISSSSSVGACISMMRSKAAGLMPEVKRGRAIIRSNTSAMRDLPDRF